MAGADLILSVDSGNLNKVASLSSEVAAVVIPTNQSKGYFPQKIEERVYFLEKIINRANKLGMKKLLGDLILEPLNVLNSMLAFRKFSIRNPEIPIFVGVSNVTELIDADSVGVNALLAKLSSEVNASIILATEKSCKAKGTVREEVIAAKMMFLAKSRESVPKDLGIDLLVLKDKHNHEEKYDNTIEKNARVIIANNNIDNKILHSEGSFRIIINRKEKSIIVFHFVKNNMEKANLVIKGKNPEKIYCEIFKIGLIKNVNHAAYLGRELAKAEIALKTGKEYMQDMAVFNKI